MKILTALRDGCLGHDALETSQSPGIYLYSRGPITELGLSQVHGQGVSFLLERESICILSSLTKKIPRGFVLWYVGGDGAFPPVGGST